MKIFINNRFYTEDRAKVSVFDRGLLYGDGVYETMRSYNGRIFMLGEHLRRLRKSAELIDLKIIWSDKNLTDFLYRTLRANKLKSAYIRLTVTRGIGPIGLDIKLCKNPTLMIITKKFIPYPDNYYTKGVKICISEIRRNHPLCIDPQIKSLNFLNNIIARLHGKYFEYIMLNLNGYVTEGTVSNIFLVKDSVLLTPSIESGILPGITREIVISLARKNNIKTLETLIKPEQLCSADECFLTNTSIEILPVKKIDTRQFSSPGKITQFVQSEFKNLVRRKLDKDKVILYNMTKDSST